MRTGRAGGGRAPRPGVGRRTRPATTVGPGAQLTRSRPRAGGPLTAMLFHGFASEWIAAREQEGLRPRTIEFLRWCLIDHLLPEFADVPLDRMTVVRPV